MSLAYFSGDCFFPSRCSEDKNQRGMYYLLLLRGAKLSTLLLVQKWFVSMQGVYDYKMMMVMVFVVLLSLS